MPNGVMIYNMDEKKVVFENEMLEEIFHDHNHHNENVKENH